MLEKINKYKITSHSNH